MKAPTHLVLPSLLLCLALVLPASAQESEDSSSATRSDFTALESAGAESEQDLTELQLGREFPRDYQVGPGDVLLLDLGNPAGDVEQLIVSPQGDLILPVVGRFPVSGLTVPELTSAIDLEFRPFFRNYDIAITLRKPRKIEVMVSGMAQQTGLFRVFGGTRLSEFLELIEAQAFTVQGDAGGKKATSTSGGARLLRPEDLRTIEIYRDDALLREVDVTALLTYGEFEEDLVLLNEDRVHVPAIEVELQGLVVKPGTYRTFEGISVSRFLEYAAPQAALPDGVPHNSPLGRYPVFLTQGSMRHIEVIREGELLTEFDLAEVITEGVSADDVTLEGGDIVRIPPTNPAKTVVLREEVTFPGRYEIAEGDTVARLLRLAGGTGATALDRTVEIEVGADLAGYSLQVDAATSTIVDVSRLQTPIKAKPGDDGQKATAQYRLEERATLLATLPPELHPGATYQFTGGERIRVPTIEEVVYLVGAWNVPGPHLYRGHFTLVDYIGRAGGVRADGQEGEARWIRQAAPGEPLQVQYVSIKQIMLGEGIMPELQPGDMLYIPGKNNQWVGPNLLSTLLNFGTQLRLFD